MKFQALTDFLVDSGAITVDTSHRRWHVEITDSGRHMATLVAGLKAGAMTGSSYVTRRELELIEIPAWRRVVLFLASGWLAGLIALATAWTRCMTCSKRMRSPWKT